MSQELTRIFDLLLPATGETLIMVAFALFFSVVIGVPLGILLVVTRPGNILGQHQALGLLNRILNILVNFIRSIPFIILILWVIPVTKQVVGTTIGVKGAIFPLFLYAAPFIARVTETAILEIKPGIIEAFIALGASPWQIITRVLLRESRSSLILALTTAAVSLIGATAMAGTVGAGGLGHLAIRNGYQSYDLAVMNATIIVLFILVQLLQSAGNTIALKLRR